MDWFYLMLAGSIRFLPAATIEVEYEMPSTKHIMYALLLLKRCTLGLAAGNLNESLTTDLP
jgi:hypothetical protein